MIRTRKSTKGLKKLSKKTGKNQNSWKRRSYLLPHPDNHIRIAANNISDSKINASDDTNSEKAQQIFHWNKEEKSLFLYFSQSFLMD